MRRGRRLPQSGEWDKMKGLGPQDCVLRNNYWSGDCSSNGQVGVDRLFRCVNEAADCGERGRHTGRMTGGGQILLTYCAATTRMPSYEA